ncbi:MAG TPA: hypothetical protein VJS88_00250 [Chthoniobacterales bacterium]|nr:hypothetical protein [Chthoniobacterales bacterium]
MEELTSYLNDHLAGSVGALELLDRLINVYKDHPLKKFFEGLRAEIGDDQRHLQELIGKLGAEESAVRKAGAWIVEKLSRSKIDLDDAGEEGGTGLFLALEALVLGITGKRSLWRALQAASRSVPELARLDYAGLEKRAIEQCERVEAKRLEIARSVFQARP